jgi:hypothetical protein
MDYELYFWSYVCVMFTIYICHHSHPVFLREKNIVVLEETKHLRGLYESSNPITRQIPPLFYATFNFKPGSSPDLLSVWL